MTTKKNPEADVLADIDQLIDEQLAAGPTDDYTRDWHDTQGDVTCTLCGQEWHGLEIKGQCPGPWATAKEKKAFRRSRRVKPAQRYARVTTTWAWDSGSRLAAQAQALRSYAAIPADAVDLGPFLAVVPSGTFLLSPHTPEATDVLDRAPHEVVYLGRQSVRRLVDPASVIARLVELSLWHTTPVDGGLPMDRLPFPLIEGHCSIREL